MFSVCTILEPDMPIPHKTLCAPTRGRYCFDSQNDYALIAIKSPDKQQWSKKKLKFKKKIEIIWKCKASQPHISRFESLQWWGSQMSPLFPAASCRHKLHASLQQRKPIYTCTRDSSRDRRLITWWVNISEQTTHPLLNRSMHDSGLTVCCLTRSC